jgi:hypothetical protein
MNNLAIYHSKVGEDMKAQYFFNQCIGIGDSNLDEDDTDLHQWKENKEKYQGGHSIDPCCVIS